MTATEKQLIEDLPVQPDARAIARKLFLHQDLTDEEREYWLDPTNKPGIDREAQRLDSEYN